MTSSTGGGNVNIPIEILGLTFAHSSSYPPYMYNYKNVQLETENSHLFLYASNGHECRAGQG